MLEQFEYFGHQRVNDCLAALHCKAASEYSLDPDMALYTYIQENNGALNSSNDFWFEYRTINKIGYKNCSDNITALSPDIWEYVQDIVIIDDFCGTGGTLKKFLESSSAEFTRQGKVGFTGKTLYYLVVYAMDESQKTMYELEKQYGLKICFIPLTLCKKFFTSELENEKKSFVAGERTLGITKDPLGFEDTEALVAFERNTPNNTIPIFRQKTEKLTPIFPRISKHELPWTKLAQQRKNRKKQNFQAKDMKHHNG